MEVIELSGYTTAEKLEIAKRYLVKRQCSENGLPEDSIRLTDDALRTIIERYTREAGVRNLERNIAGVLRGIAAKVARDQRVTKVVNPEHVETYLGPPRFEPERALQHDAPGVATGLAYTPVGGEIIFVEAAKMPGKGTFTLTGQVGDVMRESAQAALSLVRARAKDWKIKADDLARSDIHVHVPAGGVPKDGPSAGVAMLTALVSLLSGRVVDPEVGMTGEITLRGQVLPVGGIKAKVLAAHRAGIRTVVLPKRNEPDLHEVPEDVRGDLTFVFAEHVEDVLKAAGSLLGTSKSARKKSVRKKSASKKGSRKATSKRTGGPRKRSR
jgi:ATP-dependent Lon protease